MQCLFAIFRSFDISFSLPKSVNTLRPIAIKVTEKILRYLSPSTLLTACSVSSLWNKNIRYLDPSFLLTACCVSSLWNKNIRYLSPSILLTACCVSSLWNRNIRYLSPSTLLADCCVSCLPKNIGYKNYVIFVWVK